jgi:hypothetical protein
MPTNVAGVRMSYWRKLMTKHAMSGRRTKIQKIAKDGAMNANPI